MSESLMREVSASTLFERGSFPPLGSESAELTGIWTGTSLPVTSSSMFQGSLESPIVILQLSFPFDQKDSLQSAHPTASLTDVHDHVGPCRRVLYEDFPRTTQCN